MSIKQGMVWRMYNKAKLIKALKICLQLAADNVLAETSDESERQAYAVMALQDLITALEEGRITLRE